MYFYSDCPIGSSGRLFATPTAFVHPLSRNRDMYARSTWIAELSGDTASKKRDNFVWGD